MADVSPKTLDPDLTVSLPSSAVEGLASWQSAHDASIVFERWIDDGRSAARVAVVVVNPDEAPPRKVILKLCPSAPHTAREAKRHTEALTDSPADFVATHLVGQPFEPVHLADDSWLMFQDIAGQSLTRFRPMSSLYDNALLPEMCGQILRSLLVDWNPSPNVSRTTLQDCVRKHLGRRGRPGGGLMDWQQRLGDYTESPRLKFGSSGVSAPNPLHWLSNVAGSPTRELTVLTGRTHGDLHLDNVLIPFEPEPRAASYRLIDLSGFDADSLLLRDPIHLMLTAVARHLPTLSQTQRATLIEHILRTFAFRDPPSGLQLQGLDVLCQTVSTAGDDFATSFSMQDDWHAQLALGLVGGALIQASLSFFSEEDRWWYFELAARALGSFWVDGLEVAGVPESAIPRVGPSGRLAVALANASEGLDVSASRFDGSKIAIAIVSEDGIRDPEVLSSQPWDLIVEFDVTTDVDGAYAHVESASGHTHRLITFRQEPVFGRHSTVWMAANGLEGSEPAPSTLLDWRRQCLPGIEHAMQKLARSSSRPAVLCVLGDARGRTRAVVEAGLDAFGDRSSLVAVVADNDGFLSDYDAARVVGDPSDVLAALPPRTSSTPEQRAPSIPGVTGMIGLDEDQAAWLAEVGDLLHSEVGRSAEAEANIAESFYRGARISWFELDIGADLPRAVAGGLTERVRQTLDDRGTRRVPFHHYPGAGGTTVARRVAWDLRLSYPTLVVDRLSEPWALVSRVRELNRLTDNAVLVVIESVLDGIVERAYAALRADSVPAVLLIVDRRSAPANARQTEGPIYLGPLEDANSRVEFARYFAELVPERRDLLFQLVTEGDKLAVPFFFGLTAFEQEYLGLHDYVSRSVASLTEGEAAALRLIALVHRYGGVPLPVAFLAGALEVPTDVPVALTDRVRSDVLTMLVEEGPDEWRTAHRLVATEALTQLTQPSPSPENSDQWKAGLTAVAKDLIEAALDEFGAYLPDDAYNVMAQLFIVREGETALGTDRATFSDLLTEIPSVSGRIEVMTTLAETFPDEPHFWAHLGRLLNYGAADYPAALQAMDRAIALAPEDDVLHHMKGMVLRAASRDEMRTQRDSPIGVEERVLDIVDQARAEFKQAIELEDASEYGCVALLQLCIGTIEYGKQQAGDLTYSAFLTRSDMGRYRSLLADAEDALDRIREIRGSDQPSRPAAGAEADLQAIYDDYGALLNGWSVLLDRSDVAKAPIRRRLVRAYVTRAGSWRAASRDDRRRAIELLSENLRDDPRDTWSLVDWIQVARLVPISLDLAAEFVSYSATAAGPIAREVFFYDYVIATLLALSGRQSAIADYRRKLDRSRDRASAFANRRFVYEWYGGGTELGQIVHHSDLRGWDRRTETEDPPLLRRLEGRVSDIYRPQAGEIEFGPGIRAFCTPAAAGLVAGRDENVRVSFLLGFSYDGLRTWGVKRL